MIINDLNEMVIDKSIENKIYNYCKNNTSLSDNDINDVITIFKNSTYKLDAVKRITKDGILNNYDAIQISKLI